MRERTTYLDFDLLISVLAEGYQARVLNSPAGQADVRFLVGADERDAVQVEAFDVETAKSVGEHLFGKVFDGEVLSCLRRSQDEAARQGAGLRIRLRLTEVPELASLPWEYLYDPAVNRFLVLSAETPVVRYLDLPEAVQPLYVQLPLSILVIISSPADYATLDVEREWATLREALGPLEEEGLIALERLEQASPTALQRRLREAEYHVLHFIGHGSFDADAQDGVLILEDDEGQSRSMTGEEVGTLLHDHRSLRLAFLNACEGARASEGDPFSGVAQSLVQQGIPAVVAMQFEISDDAAVRLVNEFYSALAQGLPVDADLAEARKAVLGLGDTVEWGTPVLYMRSPDGLVFDLERRASASSKRASQGLVALAALMQTPEVREAVASFRADFEAACQQVTVLGDYKRMHDLLHTMQYHCYQPIEQEARRFPDDDLSADNLLDYQLTLQNILNDLREAGSQPSLAALDMSWIEALTKALGELDGALQNSDAKQLQRSLWGMGRVLATQPSLINTRLNEAARALRLPALVEALTAVRDGVACLDLDADKVKQFDVGVDALIELNEGLTVLVSSHDHWQLVDLELRRIEAAMRNDTMELEMSWPSLKEMMAPLYGESSDGWAESLDGDATALDSAIAEGNPAQTRRHFRRYRRQAGDQFFRVDVDLKELCESLRQVGEPLTGVLDMIG